VNDRRGFHPDDDGLAFVTRWNTLVSALLVEPSIKLVARTVVEYGLTDGESVYPGNERIARQTGLSARQVQEAWHFLRAAGMAERVNQSVWTGRQRLADLYQLEIPANWSDFGVLGPNFKRFTCQECGRVFNAPPCNAWTMERRPGCATEVPKIVNRTEGLREVLWGLHKAVFCPPTRKQVETRTSCKHRWEAANHRWGARGGEDPWKIFSRARDDDWPVLS